MTPQNISFGTHPLIESLQVYTRQLADEFQQMWQRDIDYIRFEWVFLPSNAEKILATDLTLRSADKKHILIIFGILIKENEISFPSILENWECDNITFLHDIIKKELIKPPQDREIRPLSPAPIAPPEITLERTVPGLWFYATVVQHIKRYKFILDFIRPGKILECACGAGYGAVILSRLDTVTEYYGVDLSEIAVTYSKASIWDERFDFHEIDLAEPTPSLYENVVSLETLEHVPNPYRFMELLIDKMAPDGQLLLSLPAETNHGSHLNPLHFSNWNYKRLMNFLEQYFEDITVFKQQLAFLSPTVFEISEIYDRPPNEDHDEIFIAILRRPRKSKRPNIVLKRQGALGDVIWTTPILRGLRRLFPRHNLLAITQKTEVFAKNPDADLVFNMQYEPFPNDVIINLDWAYEKRRELHLLHAYAEASGISPASTHPALYPTQGELLFCATRILHYFQHRDIKRLIAVHMAATSPDRIWPKAHWQRFITDLLQQDIQLGIVVLGHDRDFSAADIGFSVNPRVLCLTRQLSLMHTAAVLSLCDLLVAPDSGVLHIAAAVNVPYLGLFNMADPATRLPLTTGSRSLWANIECRGCIRDIAPMNDLFCPRGHADCMESILPEEALTVTAQMLEAVIPERWKTRCLMNFPDKQFAFPSPLEQGILAFKQGYLETATECLSIAMAQEPDNPLPYAYLAFVSAYRGLFQEARNFIAQSTRLAPERADLVAALGEVFLKNGKPAEAAEYLWEAVQLQPDLFAAYPAFAQSLHMIGKTEEAISILQTASSLPSTVQPSIQKTLQQILEEAGTCQK